jgi:hypothetical protein
MADLLRCQDRWGRTVVLDEDRWIDHVLRRRPYFRGRERSCVEETLADPEFVTLDVDDPTRRCFYRPSPLPRPHADVLIKVVVAYRANPDGGPDTGTVVTVYPMPKQKTGERRLWP